MSAKSYLMSCGVRNTSELIILILLLPFNSVCHYPPPPPLTHTQNLLFQFLSSRVSCNIQIGPCSDNYMSSVAKYNGIVCLHARESTHIVYTFSVQTAMSLSSGMFLYSELDWVDMNILWSIIWFLILIFFVW